MEFVKYILNLVLVVPIVLLLFFITIKCSKTGFSKIGIYNHVTILEKVSVNKDSSILVLKVGKEGQVGILSSTGFQSIQHLNENEIKELEDKKNEFFEQKNQYFNQKVTSLKTKCKFLQQKK